MLVKCPACHSDISAAAPSCIKCGHPLKSYNKGIMTISLTIFALLVVIYAGFKVFSPLDHQDSPTAELTSDRTRVQQEAELIDPNLSKETHRTMQLRSVRENANLPKMVTPFIRHARTDYRIKSSTMEFTFQVMNEQLFKDDLQESLPQALTNAYCTSDVYLDLRQRGVAATWIYLSGGREIFKETVAAC